MEFLPVLFIIIGVVASLVSKAAKANATNSTQPRGPRQFTAHDSQLRQELRSLSTDAVRALRQQLSEYVPDMAGQTATITPISQPSVPVMEGGSLEGTGSGFGTGSMIYDSSEGISEDRSVTRTMAPRIYSAEDSHGKTRAPHLQDDERGYDSFTGAATFRRSAPRGAAEKINVQPLLQSPIAMANAVILTEVLHHRGGRSAQWKR